MRGFRALKLWVTLAQAGRPGLRLEIARQTGLARHLERRIEATAGFELCAHRKLSIVCFPYVPREIAGDEEAIDRLIMERMQAEGTAFLTNTTLGGRFVRRACILHYAATERDIDAMREAVRSTARRIRDDA